MTDSQVKDYIIFSNADGSIKQTIRCLPELIQYQVLPGYNYIEGIVDNNDSFVDTGKNKVVPRPVMKAHVTDMVLIGVPEGATIYIEDSTYTANGENIELEFDMPGTYEIKVVMWPYMDWSTEIEVKS